MLVHAMSPTGNADGPATPYMVRIAAATFDPGPVEGWPALTGRKRRGAR
ncbi:hypothetical protein FB559_6818 [Actinoallomurus bryophytorum]|uniref:Uncharacterized protein n=1 Tax=Actinoallomurus bryophytorum TaxID=1490222 RepID=A0A543CVE1_9ACTN|nr:hypothetical protein FB559_6818 [Actinoallomurus bryophytorum]